MAGERLSARFSLRSQLWFRWTGKCFETATSHMQTVVAHFEKRPLILEMNKPTNIILNSIAIIICGLFALMNLSEWYRVKIQERTAQYPFASEGPLPYYYKSSELYSTVTLIWGVIFLCLMAFTSWAVKKDRLN